MTFHAAKDEALEKEAAVSHEKPILTELCGSPAHEWDLDGAPTESFHTLISLQCLSLAELNRCQTNTQQGFAFVSHKFQHKMYPKYLEIELRTNFVFNRGHHTFRGILL